MIGHLRCGGGWQYTPSKQELEMLMKCRHEMLVSYAKAAFFSSAVAWTGLLGFLGAPSLAPKCFNYSFTEYKRFCKRMIEQEIVLGERKKYCVVN